jgi:hypothetical protein
LLNYRSLIFLAAVLPMSAGSIFVTEGNTLYTVDTGSLSVLNTVGLASPFTPLSMSEDPLNGLLYANDGTGTLYTINPTNGNVNTVGTLAAAGSSAPATNGQLAFDNSGDLYLQSSALTGDGGNLVYGVDPTTGLFTGTSANETYHLTGFVFNSLIGAFETLGSGSGRGSGTPAIVYDIDPSSGSLSYVSGAYTPGFGQIPDLLAVDASGILYAECSGVGSGSGSAIYCPNGATLVSFNDPNNSISQLGALPGTENDVIATDLSSFAPEPSAVILMLSGAAGLFVFRKKIF